MGVDRGLMTPEEQEKWRTFLCTGHTGLRWFRRLMRLLPSEPRCTIGYEPFGGIGGKLFSLIGHVPSRKNPQLCDT